MYNIHFNDRKNILIIKNGEEVAPGILVYDNVIDNCENIISLGLSKSGWENSTVLDKNGQCSMNLEHRTARYLSIPPYYHNDIEWFSVTKTIWHYADYYAKTFLFEFSVVEIPQLLQYYKNQGFYKNHMDYSKSTPRIASAVLYLNDVEEGGETFFDKFDVSVSPKMGRLILFPANYIYTHEAKKPISNDKFAIVTWFLP
jgi:hypothetical protein